MSIDSGRPVMPGGAGTPAPSRTGSSFLPPKAAGPMPRRSLSFALTRIGAAPVAVEHLLVRRAEPAEREDHARAERAVVVDVDPQHGRRQRGGVEDGVSVARHLEQLLADERERPISARRDRRRERLCDFGTDRLLVRRGTAVGAAAVGSSGADAASRRRCAPETMPWCTGSKVAGGAQGCSSATPSAPRRWRRADRRHGRVEVPRPAPAGVGRADEFARAELSWRFAHAVEQPARRVPERLVLERAVPWLQASEDGHSTVLRDTEPPPARRPRRRVARAAQALSAGSGSAAFAYSSAAAALRWCSRPSCGCMRSMLSRRRSKLRRAFGILAALSRLETASGERWRCIICRTIGAAYLTIAFVLFFAATRAPAVGFVLSRAWSPSAGPWRTSRCLSRPSPRRSRRSVGACTSA